MRSILAISVFVVLCGWSWRSEAGATATVTSPTSTNAVSYFMFTDFDTDEKGEPTNPHYNVSESPPRSVPALQDVSQIRVKFEEMVDEKDEKIVAHHVALKKGEKALYPRDNSPIPVRCTILALFQPPQSGTTSRAYIEYEDKTRQLVLAKHVRPLSPNQPDPNILTIRVKEKPTI